MSFGEKFSVLVSSSNLSRRKLAQALGFGSPGSIDYYMKHDKLPGYDVLGRVCEHFGVSPEYFGTTAPVAVTSLHQDEKKYLFDDAPIPILSDESENALQTGVLNLSGIGIHSGFAIVVDERLETLGFPLGSTLYLSTRFEIDSVDIAIVEYKKERFFASVEMRGKSLVILPLDRTKPPVTVGTNQKDVRIIASLENILIKPNLINFRR